MVSIISPTPPPTPPLGKRHGFHLDCQTCDGGRTYVGGIEDAKQFSDILQDYKRQHQNHTYSLKQSYHAAELAHATQFDTTRHTTTSTSYGDFTNNSIASTSFTAGKKYLICVTAVLDTTATTVGAKMKIVHGSTDFADSECNEAPNNVTSTFYMGYSWFTVFTQPAGGAETIKAQIAVSATGTMGVDQFSIVAIKLSDDLTENTDWHYNEVTASTALTTSDSTTNNATVTFTPGTANDKWLVMSKARGTTTSATRSIGSRIVSAGTVSDTTPFYQIEPQNTTDIYVQSLSRVFSLGAISQTFTEKSFSVTANANNRSHSGIFALNLSKMRNEADSYTSTLLDVTGTAWASANEIATISITPDVQGDVWAYGCATFDLTNVGINFKARIQIDNTTDIPSDATTDIHSMERSKDATDECPWNAQGMDNSTAAAHTYDMDAYLSAPAAGRATRCRSLFAVTMELPAAGGAALVEVIDETEAIQENIVVHMKHVEVVPETEAIIENVGVRMKHLEHINEAEAIQENIGVRMKHVEAKDETEAITENVLVQVKMAPRLVNETEAVTENILFTLGRSTVVNETVSVGEDVVVKINRIEPPINETVSISEQVIVKVTMAPRIVNETEAVTENVVYRMNMARVINETESILENVIAQVSLPAKVVNEVEAITENVVVKLGLSHVIDETVAIPENVVVLVRRVNPPINETLEIGENIVVKVNRVEPPINEQVSILEQIVVHVRNVRPPVNETIGISESVIARLGITQPPVNETVTIPENVVVSIKTIQPIAETIDVGENIVVRINRINSPINETIEIPETVIVRMDRVNPPINETVAITENVIAALGITRPPINETISIPENVVVKLQLAYPIVNETVEISEATVLRMDRVEPSIDEIINIPEDVIVRLDRVELVGEQLSISENIIVKLTAQLTEEVNEVVSISENVTVKITQQQVFPAPATGGGAGIRVKAPKMRQKRRVWPQMSVKTYNPVKYVRQDRRYKPPTIEQQLSMPRTKVRRAFTAIYDVLPLSHAQQTMQLEQQQLDILARTLNETQGLQKDPNLQVELSQLLQQRQIQPKPAKVAKSFVAKYDILSKINKSFTMQYEKSILVSKTFIASYDIKVFDWAKLRKLQAARTILSAMAAMEEVESIDALDE